MGAISTKFHRDVFAQARQVVEAAGGSCRLDRGTSHGHGKLIIELGGKVRSTPLSTTPRNRADAIRYKIADVRRILREMLA